ncbi:hypothetical protein K1T71_008839 [Dendrolimus kikuchii]|uniref:Uncharacterized protein n=1 Tax=Dendrolimus kikuchii TaxID=765133 RepID=A0ACC1CVK7_9NEOP|nr:hypothetical protein K1T71_008839 [Dendrolimus kikuchii]
MDVCRVCLSTESTMIPIDESFIEMYNTLTSLNVKMSDELPQYTCEKCVRDVKTFMEFREKSISSETALRRILIGFKPESNILNEENKYNELADNTSMILKKEIKNEIYDDELLDDAFDDTLIDCKEDILLGLDTLQDVKPERRPKRIRIKRKKKLKINNNSTLLWNVQADIKQEESEKLFCGLCKAAFEDVLELNEHLEKHIKDTQCAICNEITFTWAELLSHRLNHVPVKQKRCHLCYKRFSTCNYLQFHYMKEHFGEKSSLTCSFCFSSYDSPRKLRKHIWAMHSDKKYICDYCSKCFSVRANLRSHIISHMKRKNYVCDLCGVSFNYLSGLKDHTIRKHVSSKVYCRSCKRPFSSQDDHDRHKCANIKNVLCPTCGKYYTTSQIKRHLITHTNITTYKCNRCPATYKSRSGLKVHLDKHDGNKTQQCQFCAAKFYSGSTLIKHRRIHTGEKPYVCKICSKAFTGNHNLKVHMKVHGEYLVNKRDKTSETDTNHHISFE